MRAAIWAGLLGMMDAPCGYALEGHCGSSDNKPINNIIWLWDFALIKDECSIVHPCDVLLRAGGERYHQFSLGNILQ